MTALAGAALLAATGCSGGSSPTSLPLPSRHIPALAPCPAAAAPATAATPLPDITLPCLGAQGEPVALRTLTGTPTVLNLYASWCGPCQTELPGLASFAAKAGERVRVLGVDTKDTAGSAADLLAKTGVRYPSVYDEDGKLYDALTGTGLPITVVVDRTGAVATVHRGPVTEQELIALVARGAGVRV